MSGLPTMTRTGVFIVFHHAPPIQDNLNKLIAFPATTDSGPAESFRHALFHMSKPE